MASVSIAVKDKDGREKALASGENQAILVFEGQYEEGDVIVLSTEKTDAHYVVRIDDCMDESLVYITKREVTYFIPFGEKKVSYNPKAFTGERHYLTIRTATSYEEESYRNLGKLLPTCLCECRNKRRSGICSPQRHRRGSCRRIPWGMAL